MAKRGQGFLHSFYFFFLVHLTLMEPFPNKKKHVLVLKLRLEQKQTKSTLFLLFVKLTPLVTENKSDNKTVLFGYS